MGVAGREWAIKNGLTGQQMGQTMIEMIDCLFATKRESRPLFTVTKLKSTTYTQTGIVTQ